MEKDAAKPRTRGRAKFYGVTDWLAFALTSFIALAGYFTTLAPEVTFDYTGVNATAAMYPSASVPSGHPVWAIYGWVFVKAFPFGNVAWRLNLASAVAGALACGLLALTVSRVSIAIVKHAPPGQRIVCSVVAGLGLAFDGALWSKAVIADTWPLTLLLFACANALLTRSFFRPRKKGSLFVAAFMLGLALSESQALIPGAFGLCLFAALRRPKVKFSFANVRTVSTLALLFAVGLAFYLLLPIFSMTNPPINWGYARTEEGFWHVVQRGQFDRIRPVASIARMTKQWLLYGRATADDLGLLYLVAAAVPFVFVRKLSRFARRWLIGALLLWFVTTLLMLVALNTDPDVSAIRTVKSFFALTHFFLLQLSGCGLMLLAAKASGEKLSALIGSDFPKPPAPPKPSPPPAHRDS